MKENEFNPIGIDSQLDMPRIAKLLRIGLFASLITLVADYILGYGVPQSGLDGMAGMLSKHVGKSDMVYFMSGFLGMFGITLEGLSYFGVYRLMAEKSPAHAHNLRTGIIGYVAFGACGVHVPCVMIAWIYNYLLQNAPELALPCILKVAKYFIVPATILFLLFFLYMCFVQASAFVKRKTPYPAWCAIFNVAFGMIVSVLILTPFDSMAWANGLQTGWISLGNIWMFGGLLVTMKCAKID